MAEDTIITFSKGLLGFEGFSQFSLITREEEAPFSHLQSVDDEAVSFVVTNPFIFFPDYEWDLPAEVQEELDVRDTGSVEVLSIVIVSSNPVDSTINLMAPLVINKTAQLGAQCVLHNSAYGVRVPLLQPEVEVEPVRGG